MQGWELFECWECWGSRLTRQAEKRRVYKFWSGSRRIGARLNGRARAASLGQESPRRGVRRRSRPWPCLLVWDRRDRIVLSALQSVPPRLLSASFSSRLPASCPLLPSPARPLLPLPPHSPRIDPPRSVPALRLSHATPRARSIVLLARPGTECSASHPFNPANKAHLELCMNVHVLLISRWHHPYVIPGVFLRPDPLASSRTPGPSCPQASTSLDHNF